MAIWTKTLIVAAATFVSLQALAQQAGEDSDAVRLEAAEARLAAEQARMQEALKERELRRVQLEQQSRVTAEESERRMREAEMRLEEAARQVADLSMQQLPRVEQIERIIRASRGPVLGVTIGETGKEGPAEGVEILGITPGGAAEDAGLQAGDIITSINGEALAAESGRQANRKLLDFMQGIEDGDELQIEYLRDGKSDKVSLVPRPMADHLRVFRFDGDEFKGPQFDVRVAPGVRAPQPFVWFGADGGFGDMEMVTLTERLGRYFGTSEGVLVVRAPGNEELKLEDGDVILSIDGRKPNSVGHAMRILGSYQAGEELKIEIMRDKKKRSIDIVVPDSQHSLVRPNAAPLVPDPVNRVVVVGGQERT